jgi:Domain of unknown function (DUF4382)
MRCLPRSLWNALLSAVVVFACLALGSCGGTTCVAGIFPNGNGVIIVKNSTPPPACPFLTGMGMMNVTAAKSEICEFCTASSRAQHIFVTLKSIQLHSVFPDSPDNPQWLELAPQLLREPRQIDLLSDSTSEILVQSASVPAGTYRELRLQFLPGTPADLDALPAENSCGHNRRNCMLMADGRVEEFDFMGNGDSPELLLPLQYNGSSALAVVPGATVDLRFTLQPQQVFAISPSEGWQIHYVLVGSASVSR